MFRYMLFDPSYESLRVIPHISGFQYQVASYSTFIELRCYLPFSLTQHTYLRLLARVLCSDL